MPMLGPASARSPCTTPPCCRIEQALGYRAGSSIGSRVMTARSIAAKLALVAGILVWAGAASAAEIKVMSSGGFAAAYRDLAKEFERTTEHKVVNIWGPSMGSTPQAIRNRLA